MKPVNRCMYCQSPNYGKGCCYAPNGVHFHPEDPKLCSYCGSPNYGRGCSINPFSKDHIHGIMYNNMFKESLATSFFVNELFKPITEFKAYKLGIIDESGNRVKEPVTEEEKAAYTPVVRTLLKVKRYLGSKLDLITQSTILEKENSLNYNREQHKVLLEFSNKYEDIFSELHKVTDSAIRAGLSLEQIESLLRR